MLAPASCVQVFFALPGKVMRLKPIAFDRQVAFLVRNLKMDEAFTLLDSTTEESRKVRAAWPRLTWAGAMWVKHAKFKHHGHCMASP